MKRAFMVTINLTDASIRTLDRMGEPEREAYLSNFATDDVQRLFNNRVKFITYQAEIGEETGRLHLQMYLETTDSMRTTTVANLFKRWLPPHTSVRVSNRESTQKNCIDYVTKDDTRVYGPWRYGEPSKSHRSSKHRKHKSVLLDCIAKGMTPRQIWLMYPDVYMTHYRFIEHLQRAGLWGTSPDVSDEEE